MRIIKLGASVIALVTALGGYVSWKYGTTSVCEAAGIAIRDEMPKVIDELAETDARFRALRIGRALSPTADVVLSGVSGELARREAEKATAIECAMMVGWREVDAPGFRASVASRVSDELAANLPGF